MAKIINPYDDTIIAEVKDFSESDVRAAIGRAYTARDAMVALAAYQRGAILNRAAGLIHDQADGLARLMARESGKPLKYTQGEVNRSVETFGFAADEARRLHGETVPMDAAVTGVGKIAYTMRVPVGVVGAITPFNFPLNLVAHKVAPAVAAGCPIVLKPAPQTPMTALRLQKIMMEAGLPEGGFEVVTGGADVGNWLVTDPRVAMISFTGSPGVGRQITAQAGLRRVLLELGGNAATIIDAEANLDLAVKRTVVGSFAYSGQTCISIQRLYVHRACYAEFREKFIDATSELVLGDPLDTATDIGPVIGDAASERIEAWVNEATAGGATIATGKPRQGRMYPPTVLENVHESMSVMCAEVFGPIVSLVPFEDFDQALDAVNNSDFGLQAGVYTRDLNKAFRAAARLQVGGVMINDIPSFRVDQMPYGGMKDSGVGREGPRFAIDEMTAIKLVVINTEG